MLAVSTVLFCPRLAIAATAPQIVSATSASGTLGSPFFYKTIVANEQFTSLDPTKTYLVNTASTLPQFCAGDDAFTLMLSLSNQDVETYLSDRATRGFNCIWVSLADNVDQPNAPQNYYGNVPFDGSDFTNEDSAYWSHVDYVLGRMAAYGITAFASPAFVGWNGNYGYYNSYNNASTATLQAYGSFLGSRYAAYPNIVWVLGGDWDKTTVSVTKLNALGQGIAASDPNHLITVEGCRNSCSPTEQSSLDEWSGSPSMNLNWVYFNATDAFTKCASNYKRSGALPALDGEDTYEDANGVGNPSDLALREEAYQSVLGGCTLGRLSGHAAVWCFNSTTSASGCTPASTITWQNAIASSVYQEWQYEGQLMRSRKFWLMAPDSSNSVLTGGIGSGESISAAACTSDGSACTVYDPLGSSQNPQVNLSHFSGSVHAWWYNPRTGATTDLGTFPNAGVQTFSAPDSNDWVLQLDLASLNLSAPGTTSMTNGAQVVTYSASGLPSGLSVNASTGMISGTPTASGTFTVTLSATNSSGTGTATLTLTIGSSTSSGISFVQAAAKQSSGTGSSLAAAFSTRTTAGNLILVGVDFASGVSPSAITDSQGNTFTAVGSQLTTPGGASSRVYYAQNIAGGADTVTVRLSGSSSYIEVYLAEYSGASAAGPIDVQVGASGSSTSVSSGKATTTSTGDRIFGYCVADSTCMAGSGFTARSTYNNNLIEDMAAATTGSFAATGTANNGWSMQMVAVKRSSGSITNEAAQPPSITSSTTASGTAGSAFSYQITASNSPTSFSAAGLPSGLSVNTSTGLISGTPAASGTSSVTLKATNSAGSGTATLTITVSTAAPVITSSTTASGTAGSAFSYQIAASNSPTSYSATGLPSGLSVNTSTGLISGTPTASGTSSVTLKATNSAGSGTATLTITVSAAAPVITSSTTASGTAGSAFSYQIAASNSPTSYSAAGLPSGLSVNTSTGLISGTPAASGTSSVTLKATNSAGSGTATLTITIASGTTTGISFIQATAKSASSTGSSLQVAFPANTTAGNLILVGVDFVSGVSPSSITDSQGNTFTAIGNSLTTPGGASSRVYYAQKIVGGADTVTIKLSGNSGFIEAYLAEYSGASTATPIDIQIGAAGSSTSVSSGNATTTASGDRIFGYCVADWTCKVGSGFTARSTYNNNLIEDMTAASTGSFAAIGTANNGWSMQMVAIKPQ